MASESLIRVIPERQPVDACSAWNISGKKELASSLTISCWLFPWKVADDLSNPRFFSLQIWQCWTSLTTSWGACQRSSVTWFHYAISILITTSCESFRMNWESCLGYKHWVSSLISLFLASYDSVVFIFGFIGILATNPTKVATSFRWMDEFCVLYTGACCGTARAPQNLMLS